MTQSKSSSPRKNLALVAMSFAIMLGTFMVPAYGQECDPSWFNPWAQSTAESTHASQAKAVKSQHSPDVHSTVQAKAKSASPASAQSAKVRAKTNVKRSS